MDAMLLAALAALSWGTSSFFEKIGVNHGDPMAGVMARTVGVVVGTAAFAALSPATARGFLKLPPKSMLCFAVGGVLASVVGQIFFYQSLRKSDIGRVAAVGGAWPAIAFVLGVLFLGEPFSLKRAGGVLLVGLGVMLLR